MEFVFSEEDYTTLHERIDVVQRILVDACADEGIESEHVRTAIQQLETLRLIAKKTRAQNKEEINARSVQIIE